MFAAETPPPRPDRPARAARAALALVAALGMVVLSPAPAHATPSPASGEWWFAPWAIDDIWPTTTGGGVTVGVLDSGANPKIPELAGAVLPGGDVTGQGSDGRTDFDKEKDGHGTAMAALIAGQGGGRSGFVGLAPGAKILPVRLTHTGGYINSIDVYRDGIRFATDHGARVINLSLGTDGAGYPDACPEPVQQAVAYAIEHDVVVVAASGDEGDTTNAPQYPAACAGVLAVGGVDKYSNPWKGTQIQDYVDVAAPGSEVGWVGQSGTFYPNGWGTSGASALTAGAVALIRSANPDMPAREVVQRLMATAKDIGEPGRDEATGYGIIRIFRAMNKSEYPVPADAPNPTFERLDAWLAANGGATTASTGPALSSAQAPSSASVAATGPDNRSGAGWIIVSVVLVVIVFGAAIWAGLAGRRRRARNASAVPPDVAAPSLPDPAGHAPVGSGPEVATPGADRGTTSNG
jgi:type VII secretion-associated serine protease mycosin